MSCKDKTCGCKVDTGRGCEFCNCNTEATANAIEGYYKLHTTDWLDGMPNMHPDDIFEVRFKNTRRSYYKNANNLPLQKGDIVSVEASPGHDIGIVSLTGDIVGKQMKRVGFNPLNGEYKKIFRKAKSYDIEKWQESIALEHETMILSRQIAAEMGLNMKIGDVEYQGDKTKAIFYYIADERVDFRELIKVFSEQFRIRIEMKQIGARQEAGRIGGLGSCGRELCCASWISNFVSVTTNAARTQEISLNPQKLAGQCSKLKCCMVYELDNYLDARKAFPKVNQPLQAMYGEYYLVKNDILGKTMSFSTSPHAMVGMVTLSIERVREIMEMNKQGKKVEKLEEYSAKSAPEPEPSFINMIEEESITRFDKTASGSEDRSKRRKSKRGRGERDDAGGRRRDDASARDGAGESRTSQSAEGDESSRSKSRSGRNRNRNRTPEGQGARQSTPEGQGANQATPKQEGAKQARSQRGGEGRGSKEGQQPKGERQETRAEGRGERQDGGAQGKGAGARRSRPERKPRPNTPPEKSEK